MSWSSVRDFLIGSPGQPVDDDLARDDFAASLGQMGPTDGLQYGTPVPGLGSLVRPGAGLAARGAATQGGTGLAGIGARGASNIGPPSAPSALRQAGIGANAAVGGPKRAAVLGGLGAVGAAGAFGGDGGGAGADGSLDPWDTWLGRIIGRNMPSGAGAPPTERVDPMQDVEDRLSSQLAGLESSFENQKAQLQEAFQFAETPQEQALLAFQLGDLEEQRRAGHQIIGDQFAQASSFAGSQAGDMRSTAADEAAARGELFTGAAGRAGEAIDQLAGEYAGTGMAVGAQPVSGDATDWVGMLEAQAPAEAALVQNLGNIAADDMQALGAQLQGEGSAQQGALQRAALGLRADATMQHQAQVQDRIAREQSEWRQMMAQLQGQHLDRAHRIQDRQFDVDMHRAEQGGGADPNAYQHWNDLEWSAHFEQNPAALGPAIQGMFGPGARRVAQAIQQQQANALGLVD